MTTLLQTFKQALQVGTTVTVHNHYITAARDDHPCSGTRTVKVLRNNTASFELANSDGGSGGVLRWPKANDIEVANDGAFLIFGHPKPGDLFLTIRVTA